MKFINHGIAVLIAIVLGVFVVLLLWKFRRCAANESAYTLIANE